MVLLALAEALIEGEELRGIYHWQGPDRLSELEMAKILCEFLGLRAVLRARPSSRLDRALDISRVARSFTLSSTPFREGIKRCLQRPRWEQLV